MSIKNNELALIFAIDYTNPKIVEILLKYGANPQIGKKHLLMIAHTQEKQDNLINRLNIY